MRKTVISGVTLCAALLAAWTCFAQIAGFPPGAFSNKAALDPSGAVAYSGPGDVLSGALAFYSCRAYSLAKAGTKAYRIVRASDSTQTDVNSLASGLCDTATPATFCNATTCKFVTYYDQSGALACAAGTSCDVTQGTDANRPVFTQSVLNGAPCADSTLAALSLTSAATLTHAQPFTWTAVGETTTNFTTTSAFIANGSSTTGSYMGHSTSTNTVRVAAGLNSTNTASDSAFHALIGVINSGTGGIIVDGAGTAATSVGSQTLSSAMFVMTNGNPNSLRGYFCEGGLWPVAMNSTQWGNINTNMHSSTNGWNF